MIERGALLPRIVLLVTGIVLFGCAKERGTPTTALPLERAFVGTETCRSCHPDVAATYDRSGHAHILTPVVDGVRPGAPLSLPDSPPAGKAWSDIRFVIGGFGWKALFVTADGRILSGDRTQYDLPSARFADPGWTAWPGPEAYDGSCYRCHAAVPDSSAALPEQAGLPCEACHGPGSVHVTRRDPAEIRVDTSAEGCGKCHRRDPESAAVTASSWVAGSDTLRFIDSYQQYTEMMDGPHAVLKCVDCHSPHTGVRGNQSGGIVRSCTDCHTRVVLNHPSSAPTCIDCHMPRAGMSARAADRFSGDVRSHIFKIHSGPETRAGMYLFAYRPDGLAVQGYVKHGYGITRDYACYSCHLDETGRGGPEAGLTMAQINALAPHIHGR